MMVYPESLIPAKITVGDSNGIRRKNSHMVMVIIQEAQTVIWEI